jgi:hypothetical protein
VIVDYNPAVAAGSPVADRRTCSVVVADTQAEGMRSVEVGLGDLEDMLKSSSATMAAAMVVVVVGKVRLDMVRFRLARLVLISRTCSWIWIPKNA